MNFPFSYLGCLVWFLSILFALSPAKHCTLRTGAEDAWPLVPSAPPPSAWILAGITVLPL